MKINLKPITVKEIIKNYKDSAEEGVVGYNGTNKWRSKYIKKEGRRWQEVVSLFSHRTPFGG